MGVFVDARQVNDTLARVRWDAYWQKSRKEMNNYIRQDSNEPGKREVEMMGRKQTVAYDSSTAVMNISSDNRLTTLGTSLQADWQLSDDHYLITGYEFSQDKLKADTTSDVAVHMDLRSHPLSMGPSTTVYDATINPVSTRFNKGAQTTHAVFAAMESQLPHDFTASYGLRYTYVTSEMTTADARTETKIATGAMSRSTGAKADSSAGTTGKNHNDRFVFNAGLVWTGIEDLALRATWSQGFRTPLLQEKYLQNTMENVTVLGNPNLKPETSDNFEIGARFNRGPLHADAAVFYSLADNFIAEERLNNDTIRYNNIDKAKTLGLEASLSMTLADRFTPYVTMTAVRRRLESRNYSTYDSGTPSFYARYGLKTQHPVWGGTLTTDAYARSQTATKSYSYHTSETTQIAGFTTFNLAAGYRFGKESRFSVDAELLNLFNQTYQYNVISYEAGRTFNMKLTAHY